MYNMRWYRDKMCEMQDADRGRVIKKRHSKNHVHIRKIYIFDYSNYDFSVSTSRSSKGTRMVHLVVKCWKYMV